ncbi:MAG: NB-ARC domain-containing protein [Anaerolineae bacterium]|nr:NB-ARC domain-containing protein [Anaerolineae bacterium]
MDWLSIHTDLRDVFAYLYSETKLAKQVAQTAGINLIHLELSAAPTSAWHVIIEEAIKQNRLEQLITEVDKTYSDNHRLKEAIGKFRKTTTNSNTKSNRFRSAPRDYTLQNKFHGRDHSLTALNDWVRSEDPIMIIHSMGGMGKTALCWEWVKKHVQNKMDFEGIFWFSFYDKGGNLDFFVNHALAFVENKSFENLKHEKRSNSSAAESLRNLLKERKFLIIIDGLERILRAYQDIHYAQLTEDAITKKQDLKEHRCCVESEHDSFLLQLIGCSQSKILISSRLIPTVFEGTYQGYLPGITIHKLDGLRSEDAVNFAKSAGIKRVEVKDMVAYFNKFGNHPVIIKSIAGLVAHYPFGPGNFDKWYLDEGYKLNLSEVDQYKQVTEVLNYVTQGLAPDSKLTLALLAVFGEAIDATMLLHNINPFLPPKPSSRDLPAIPNLIPNPLGSRQQAEQQRHPQAYRLNKNTTVIKHHHNLTYQMLSSNNSIEVYSSQERNFKQRLSQRNQAITRRSAVYQAQKKQPAYVAGITRLNDSLKDLGDRGLIDITEIDSQFVYDLHPLVRAYITDENGLFDKKIVSEARSHLLDKLSQRPVDRTDKRELQNFAIEYRGYLESGQYDSAASVYINLIDDALFESADYITSLSYLNPFIENDLRQLKLLADQSNQLSILNAVLACYAMLNDQANFDKFILLNLQWRFQAEDAASLIYTLSWYAYYLAGNGRLREVDYILNIAIDGAKKIKNDDLLAKVYSWKLDLMITIGQTSEINNLLNLLAEIASKNVKIASYQANNTVYLYARIRLALRSGADPAEFFKHLEKIPRAKYHLGYYLLQAQYKLINNEFADAKKIAELGLNTLSGKGINCSNLWALKAEICQHLSDTAEVNKAIEKSLFEFEKTNISILQKAATCNALARIYCLQNNQEEALRYANMAFEYAICEGEPYTYWQGIEEAKQTLQTLSVSIPSIPFVRDNITEMPYDREAHRVLAQAKGKPNETREKIEIKLCRWFQIGVTAFFNVKTDEERQKMTAIGCELYALSSDPGPVSVTTADELVDRPPLFSYLEDCIPHKEAEELDLSFIRQAAHHDCISIVYICADTQDNKIIHFFMSVRSEQMTSLYLKCQSGTLFDVSTYGRVVSGPFDDQPSKEQLDDMFDNWLFCSHFLPLKVISRKAGEDS